MSAITNIATRLEGLLGASRTITSEEDLREYAVDGVVPGAIVRPANAEEVAELVRFAVSDGLGLIPSGSRSKMELGMPPLRYDTAVDMRPCRTLPITTRRSDPKRGCGNAAANSGKSSREKRQFFPFSVPCYETSTIGGALASGIDSTLRQQYGTVRDFLIGAEFVDGKGNLCKSGGRVVKNVTGYDLHKLLVGSLGTLGYYYSSEFSHFSHATSFWWICSQLLRCGTCFALQSSGGGQGPSTRQPRIAGSRSRHVDATINGKSQQTSAP